MRWRFTSSLQHIGAHWKLDTTAAHSNHTGDVWELTLPPSAQNTIRGRLQEMNIAHDIPPFRIIIEEPNSRVLSLGHRDDYREAVRRAADASLELLNTACGVV